MYISQTAQDRVVDSPFESSAYPPSHPVNWLTLSVTMSKEQATYSHGHHSSVVQSHARRTAQNSAGFLLPHIKPTDSILDLGCGPGSITVDFAALVPEGKVVGGDAVAEVLNQASELARSRNLKNITFETIDANFLKYEDDTFDIVFCHQLLQHVKDPIGILREMRRVTKPGGIIAAREADYKGFRLVS